METAHGQAADGASLGDPGILVAADAVQHVQDGIFGLGVVLIAGRGIDRQAAVEAGRGGRIPDLGHGAVRDPVDGVQVGTGALFRDEEDAREGGDVPVHEHVVRVDHRLSVHTESVGVHLGGNLEGGRVLPDAVLPLFEDTHAGDIGRHLAAVHLEFAFFRGQEVTRDFHLHGLGILIPERDGTVGIDDGRLHVGASEKGLLRKGGNAQEQTGRKNN